MRKLEYWLYCDGGPKKLLDPRTRELLGKMQLDGLAIMAQSVNGGLLFNTEQLKTVREWYSPDYRIEVVGWPRPKSWIDDQSALGGPVEFVGAGRVQYDLEGNWRSASPEVGEDLIKTTPIPAFVTTFHTHREAGPKSTATKHSAGLIAQAYSVRNHNSAGKVEYLGNPWSPRTLQWNVRQKVQESLTPNQMLG